MESTPTEGVYKYEDVQPINSYQSTVWLVEFENGAKILNVWHKDAKIENIVESAKMEYPDIKFTVAAINVGTFCLYQTGMSMSNGRKLNQDMEVVL